MPQNVVFLIGHVTRDIDLKRTPKGKAVAEMGLAINRVTFNDEGQKREEVTFVDVTLWGRDAEVAGEYLSKGREVSIQGRLQMDTWEDKTTGTKRTKLRVICEQLNLLSNGGAGKAANGDRRPAAGGNGAGDRRPAAAGGHHDGGDDDENPDRRIPF